MLLGRPPKSAKTTFTCKQCGNIWEAYAWNNDRKDYCSRACFYKSRTGRPKQYRVTPKQRACLTCGETFLIGGEGNRKKDAKYCSRSCAKIGAWGEKQHAKARDMSLEEKVWFAGIFDGEGCVAWPRRKVINLIRLNLTSTSKALIDRIVEITGTGKVAEVKSKSPRHSQAWTWSCYSKNATSILRQIHPWLIVKKEAADVALGLVEAIEPPWTQRSRTMQAAAK